MSLTIEEAAKKLADSVDMLLDEPEAEHLDRKVKNIVSAALMEYRNAAESLAGTEVVRAKCHRCGAEFSVAAPDSEE